MTLTSPSRVRLSVLDQSPIGEVSDHDAALRHTVERAKATDVLGCGSYTSTVALPEGVAHSASQDAPAQPTKALAPPRSRFGTGAVVAADGDSTAIQ
ncbi:hypothetical protein ACIGW1_07010 [Streptomyces sp. NPDC053780]|uniref:hypothetical protein n=1 Tax=unclassified Streptomyces TaxID=2593676 RepID=UPI003432DDC7